MCAREPCFASTKKHQLFCAGRWPWQTKSEDANQGLEANLAGLVTTARDWLISRDFMAMDGPWVGGKKGGGISSCIGWRKAVVVRTHAAMCAAAMLKPGWGPGHRVMGEAEQVPRPRASTRVKIPPDNRVPTEWEWVWPVSTLISRMDPATLVSKRTRILRVSLTETVPDTSLMIHVRFPIGTSCCHGSKHLQNDETMMLCLLTN